MHKILLKSLCKLSIDFTFAVWYNVDSGQPHAWRRTKGEATMNNLKLYEKMNNEVIKYLFDTNNPARGAVGERMDANGEWWTFYTLDGHTMRVLPSRFFYVSSTSDNLKTADFLAKFPDTMDESRRVEWNVNINGEIRIGEDKRGVITVTEKSLLFYGKRETLALYKDKDVEHIAHITRGGVYVGLVFGKVAYRND